MPITPDERDWTFVLERPCPECGFDAATLSTADVAPRVRESATTWRALLAHRDAARRPSEDRWSALEYACHLRDVYRLFDERLALMRREARPRFAGWDQDAAAVEGRYRAQDPAHVAAELADAAGALAASFEAVAEDEWARTGVRDDGARFTVATFARYLVHEVVHHALDAEQGYATLAGRP
ncbi:MAG TPA: DinB family protein [Acidimicrobiales bacterium]|nr:DinB family protein [Acidimicrobiales bacterium]